MNTTPRSSFLYNFYQGLSDRFVTIEGLMEHALPAIAEYLAAERVFFFNWDEKRSIISQRIMCDGQKSYYLQEDIFIDPKSPEVLKFLEDGVGDSPSLDYPAVYVLLKWRTPRNSLKTLQSGIDTRSQYGVLRVERFKKDKTFTRGDKEILLSIARELSLKMNMTEIDQYNIAQLKHARALNNLAHVFATSIRLADSIEEILKSIQSTFQFDRTSLYLIGSDGNMESVMTVDISGGITEEKLQPGFHQNFCAGCDGDGSGCNVFAVADISVVLPLKVQNKNLGCLVFDNLLSRRLISDADVLPLRQFSTQIALAIDNARLFEKVQELSNYDELTKLALRRFFNDNFSKELYRSERFNLGFSLILLDIDRFKVINDTYGHIVGDEALKAVSDVIRGGLRQTDMPSRFGGDEMAILLPRTTGEEAMSIAKRLSAKVAAIKLPERFTRGADIKISISQGISVYPYDGETQAELIAAADAALYHVKQSGRGSYALYSDLPEDKNEHI